MPVGFRNHYRTGTSWPEAIGKDLRSLLGDGMRFIRNGFQLPVIVSYPDFPSTKTTLYKIAGQLNYRITNCPQESPAVVIYFEDKTFGDASAIRSMYLNSRILNMGCTDISKKKVDAVHQEVFGYNTFIDPTHYQGKAVQKSDINALHDGRIVNCPVTVKEEKSVYQVLINNEYSSEFVVDYRVPVIAGKIPHVYQKFKSHADRFTNLVHHSSLHLIEGILSEEEQSLILKFASAMQVDFCEFDVLRNLDDGKIYIIDVNKTPYGPPAGLSEMDRKVAIDRLVEAFRGLL